jgi:hypothetical protein
MLIIFGTLKNTEIYRVGLVKLLRARGRRRLG